MAEAKGLTESQKAIMLIGSSSPLVTDPAGTILVKHFPDRPHPKGLVSEGGTMIAQDTYVQPKSLSARYAQKQIGCPVQQLSPLLTRDEMPLVIVKSPGSVQQITSAIKLLVVQAKTH